MLFSIVAAKSYIPHKRKWVPFYSFLNQSFGKNANDPTPKISVTLMPLSI